MSSKFFFHGHLNGTWDPLESPLEVFITEYSISVGRSRGLGRTALEIFHFHGRMLFHVWHKDGKEIVNNGYCLTMSGTNLGYYENGGGRDGEFEVAHLKEVELRAKFSGAGLAIDICAKTLPGEAVCYSAGERLKNAFSAMTVLVNFIVPPEDLPAFLGLPNVLSSEAFSKFHWHKH